MNPHPSHKIRTIKVVKNHEILYCDNCALFASHPEIEQPCKRISDLLAKVLRRDALQREFALYKSGRWSSIRPFEK